MTSESFIPDILVIGGAHIDRIGRSSARLEAGQSNPGILTRNVGGVAGNIARCLAKLNWAVALSTITGKDDDAELLRQQLLEARIDTSLLWSHASSRSASYTAIEDTDGSLVAAIADMGIYDSYPVDRISDIMDVFPSPASIVADTNLPPSVLEMLAKSKGGHQLVVSAVSGPKANRARSILCDIDLLFCNEAEAAILADEYADLPALPEILMDAGVKSGIITKGNAGLTAWQGGKSWSLPAPPVKVKSSNGAGDTLTACVLHALLLKVPFEKALSYGMAGASLSLMSEQAVPDILNRVVLDACIADIPQS
nr:carbohydrate kinase family protein [uncultured Cohaesibacter sp.]